MNIKKEKNILFGIYIRLTINNKNLKLQLMSENSKSILLSFIEYIMFYDFLIQSVVE